MKVRIDDQRCQGHGRCYAIASAVFEPDELGQGRVLGSGDVPTDEQDAARRAAQNCPEGAVVVEEDDR